MLCVLFLHPPFPLIFAPSPLATPMWRVGLWMAEFQKLDEFLKFYTPFLGKHLPGMPGATTGPVPIIRMFGITMEGNSVLCHIHGFTPYLYVPAPKDFKQEHCSKFRDGLNKLVVADMKSNKDNVSQAVLAVDVVIKESKWWKNWTLNWNCSEFWAVLRVLTSSKKCSFS